MRLHFILIVFVWIVGCDTAIEFTDPKEEFIIAQTSNYTRNAIYIQAFWTKGTSQRVEVAPFTRVGKGPSLWIPFADIEPEYHNPANGIVRGDTIRFRAESTYGNILAEIKMQYVRFGGEDEGCVSPGQVIFEERSNGGYQLWTRIGCGYFRME